MLGMDRPIIGSGVRVAAIQKSDVPSLLVQRVARLRPTARLDADYLLILLHSRMFADYMEPIFTGISVPHLSPEQIKGFCLPLPPLDEQRAIVALTMVQTEGIDATAAKLCDEISLLQEYRTRLTTDVVTGKLDVREAASKLPDEPIDHDSPSELVDDLVDEEVAVE